MLKVSAIYLWFIDDVDCQCYLFTCTSSLVKAVIVLTYTGGVNTATCALDLRLYIPNRSQWNGMCSHIVYIGLDPRENPKHGSID